MKSNRWLLSVAFSMLGFSAASAQTGPWQDGELIIRSVVSVSNQTEAIYRVNSLTGHGEMILTDFVPTGHSSNMAFDSYRNAFLVSAYIAPDNYQNGKLWQVFADGSKLATPNTNGIEFRCLAPVGDGRIYFQDHKFVAQGVPKPIKYLDAANNIHTLMDETGTAPYAVDYTHLLYHKPTNSLFATVSGSSYTAPCTPSMASFFRIPLTADGSQVAGPVDCASYATTNEDIMNMDLLASGKILISIASGAFFSGAKLITLDPNTMAISPWASPQLFDTNGGYFLPQLNKAVVLNDALNTLHTFSQGSTGTGAILTVDVPISPNTSGYGPSETLVKVDTNGVMTLGYSFSYGSGLAGTGGFVPSLHLTGIPDLNQPWALQIDNARGGAYGVLWSGMTQATTPFWGGTLLLVPMTRTPLLASGALGVGGVGSATVPMLTTDPAMIDVPCFFQAAFRDPLAAQGVSLTNGLQVVVGL